MRRDRFSGKRFRGGRRGGGFGSGGLGSPGGGSLGAARLGGGRLGRGWFGGGSLGRGKILAVTVAACGLAVLARLWLAWSFHGNFDQGSFDIVRGLVDRGENVYAGTFRYNYSPVWFLLIWLFSRIADATGLPFQFVIRASLTGVDVATALLLAAAARSLGVPPLRTAVIFLVNPVSILITGYHGQFDNIALLFVVAAVVVQLERPRALLASTLLGAGVLVKQIVAPHVLFALGPSVRSPLGRLLVAAAIGAVLVLTLVPFATSDEAATGILGNVFGYGVYGGRDLTLLASFVGVARVLVLVVAGLLAHRLPVERAALLASILFVAMAATSLRSPQYLVLPIALGALHPSPMYWLYTAASVGLMAAHPDYGALPIDLDWWLPWSVSIGWLVEFGLMARRQGWLSRTAVEGAAPGGRPFSAEAVVRE